MAKSKNELQIKETGLAVKATNDDPSPPGTKASIAFGTEIDFLGFGMQAALESAGTDTTRKTKILIKPSNAMEKQEVSLSEMIERINATFNAGISTDSIAPALSYIGLTPDKTNVCLNQAFLLYDSSQTSNKLEYAFSISVVNGEEKSEGVFTLKSISFSVWNTTRAAVIKTMALGTIAELLKQLDESK